MTLSTFPWLRVALIWAFVVIAFHTALAGIFIAAGMGYERTYIGKHFPGATIQGIAVGGLTREESTLRIQQRIDTILREGLKFEIGDRRLTIPLTSSPAEDPDVARDLAYFDVDAAVKEAYTLGRTGNFWIDLLTRFRMRVVAISIPVATRVHEEGLRNALNAELNPLNLQKKDAELVIRVEKPANTLRVSVTPEQDGRSFDTEAAIGAAREMLPTLELTPIQIPVLEDRALIRSESLATAAEEAKRWMTYPPLTLTTDEKKWTITSSTAAEWLTATATASGFALTVDQSRFTSSVRPLLQPYMKTAQDGFLKLDENNKLVEFVAPIEGVDLAVATSIQMLVDAWSHGSTTIPLTLERRVPQILGPDAERLGIKEALGTGLSYFSGSPANRRFNIALGSKKVHGSLIAPGETFSLLKTLGAVNGANGWLPELVIKGNKTTPEFGGGLCQVGTTVFRTTLAAGLPIVERRNHSYRVRYYEPAGTDATIYEPSPDYRFRNDTGHSILITTENKDSRLAYTIWGTNDGRVASSTKPRIYNITAPPPKQMIETTDLPPGKIKCTESAHAGASASFDYHVTYKDGTTSSTTFNSYYRPWGAVCLVGVEKVTAGQEGGVDETGVNNPN